MKRRIAVIIGSDSDLPQCLGGLQFLKEARDKNQIELEEVFTNSVHRNLAELALTLGYLRFRADVIITAAGWANHLTGCVDAWLRYYWKSHIVVVGVAIEDANNPKHTKAAILSITEVPKTQVVFDNYVGEKGFFRACKFAVEDKLPEIKNSEAKSTQTRSVEQAIRAAIAKKQETGGVK